MKSHPIKSTPECNEPRSGEDLYSSVYRNNNGDGDKKTVDRLVLFDIDQTLISTDGAGSRALIASIAKYLNVEIEKVNTAGIRFAGKTDPQIVEEIIRACDNAFAEAEKLQNSIEEILETYLQLLPQSIAAADDYFVHEGVSEILAALQEHEHIMIGLLTGNVEAGARLKLERVQLNHFFPIGSFGSDSASRLDLPAIAHQRAQAFYNRQFKPDQIVIIGDAENDVLCAKHYGAVSLAVNTGKTTWEQLSQHSPEYIFPSLKDTEKIMQAILNGKQS